MDRDNKTRKRGRGGQSHLPAGEPGRRKGCLGCLGLALARLLREVHDLAAVGAGGEIGESLLLLVRREGVLGEGAELVRVGMLAGGRFDCVVALQVAGQFPVVRLIGEQIEKPRCAGGSAGLFPGSAESARRASSAAEPLFGAAGLEVTEGVCLRKMSGQALKRKADRGFVDLEEAGDLEQGLLGRGGMRRRGGTVFGGKRSRNDSLREQRLGEVVEYEQGWARGQVWRGWGVRSVTSRVLARRVRRWWSMGRWARGGAEPAEERAAAGVGGGRRAALAVALGEGREARRRGSRRGRGRGWRSR